MAQSEWREHSASIIWRVLTETKGQDAKAVRKALHDAYPYGLRENHPYKIWLSEIAKQQGRLSPTQRRQQAQIAAMNAQNGQADLFGRSEYDVEQVFG